jgi:cysteinyl-tRNA synthetase
VSKTAAQRCLGQIDIFGDVLGLFQKVRRQGLVPTDALLDILVQIREEARKRKDFAVSDLIRDKLKEIGVTLEDAKEGVRWKLK